MHVEWGTLLKRFTLVFLCFLINYYRVFIINFIYIIYMITYLVHNFPSITSIFMTLTLLIYLDVWRHFYISTNIVVSHYLKFFGNVSHPLNDFYKMFKSLVFMCSLRAITIIGFISFNSRYGIEELFFFNLSNGIIFLVL